MSKRKISRTKGSKCKHMIQGLLSIVDGLVRLITLGTYWSNLEYTYVIKNIK